MKFIKVGLAGALMILALAGFARAADTTASIAVTVSLQPVIEVSVSPGTWNIGAITPSSVSGPTTFTATVGNTATKLEIMAANPTGSGWTIGASPAADVFQVAVSDPAINLTTDYQILAGIVTHYGSQAFALTYKAPTSDTKGAETDETFAITVRASSAP
ncbi:MAG: hypothetical protein NTX50_18770 [Candidatus Sumerlaeota bacterium]|nr:hypothetical protein [Candidatus Sumerlaeota bacterium]